MDIHSKSTVLVIRWEPRERGALVRACLAWLPSFQHEHGRISPVVSR